MRIIGRRREPVVTFSATASQLEEGARFNEEIHRLPTGHQTHIRKGLYRFKTHEDANRHDLEHLAASMATIARQRG